MGNRQRTVGFSEKTVYNGEKGGGFLEEIEKRLFSLAEPDYRAFQCRLMPTVPKERVIGVRTPLVRALAKEFGKTPQAAQFLRELPHKYYEEDNLHAFILEGIKDFDECVAALDEFLPFVDNWATCDSMKPKVFLKHKKELLEPIGRWMASGDTYTVRFAVELLMNLYLDGDFDPAHLEWVAGIKSEEYYINMMVAWYFATALAKRYDKALPFVAEHRLSPWVHQKTIQKAVESFRLSEEQKTVLKQFRDKKEK